MGTTIFFCGLVFFIGSLFLSLSVFKIQDIYLGLPSSIFMGRFKAKKDSNGNSIPIREPYAEGIHFKWPWWSIKQFSREIKTLPIERKAYPVGTSGTVYLTGTIQYRPSPTTLYRLEEVDEDGINTGLFSELDQIVADKLGTDALETAVTRKTDISKDLLEKLTGENISQSCNQQKTRTLFNRTVTYAEHSYGIQIVKATITEIDLPPDLKLARDDEQKERYQKRSQTTEWEHLIEKMEMMKKAFPDLKNELILEAMQIWQKQTTKNISEFKIPDLGSLADILKNMGIGGKP